jgi:hypothetical protein
MLPVREESQEEEEEEGQVQSFFPLVCFYRDSDFGKKVPESGAGVFIECL